MAECRERIVEQNADGLMRHYRSPTDDELLGIAATGELTDIADKTLRAELARRQLGDSRAATKATESPR